MFTNPVITGVLFLLSLRVQPDLKRYHFWNVHQLVLTYARERICAVMCRRPMITLLLRLRLGKGHNWIMPL